MPFVPDTLQHPPGADQELLLEDHTGTVRIGGKNITNLRYADHIDGIAGNEAELAILVRQLDGASLDQGRREILKNDGQQQLNHHSRHLSSGPKSGNSAAVPIPWSHNL